MDDQLRDCQCVFHTGPCWLHNEAFAIELQAEQLENNNIPGFLHVLGRDLEMCLYNRRAAGQQEGETLAELLRRKGWSEAAITQCMAERQRALDRRHKAALAAAESNGLWESGLQKCRNH